MYVDSVVQIVIRLGAAPQGECRRILEKMLDGHDGIMSVSFSSAQDYMVVVRYDTNVIHAQDVLELLAGKCKDAHVLWAF